MERGRTKGEIQSRLKPPHHALHVQALLSGVQFTQRVDPEREHAVTQQAASMVIFLEGSAILSLTVRDYKTCMTHPLFSRSMRQAVSQKGEGLLVIVNKTTGGGEDIDLSMGFIYGIYLWLYRPQILPWQAVAASL